SASNNAQDLSEIKEKQRSLRGETFRVLIDTTASNLNATTMKEVKVRNQFSANSFTTDVTEKEYQALKSIPGVKVEKVEILSIQADMKSLKLNDEIGTAAASQSIPWGIKAIYNNNSLTQTSGGNNVRIAILDT
ncbi:hypothetical protein J4G37_51855, partial [Microvirga sp. 3-52]|nr:hypothetical protein [Microvirga sp. 3-52]